jgi:hypothetical protein
VSGLLGSQLYNIPETVKQPVLVSVIFRGVCADIDFIFITQTVGVGVSKPGVTLSSSAIILCGGTGADKLNNARAFFAILFMTNPAQLIRIPT